jgi:hypothetical protein
MIITPERIDEALFQGKLILQADESGQIVKGGGEKLTRSELGELDMPRVTLGRPEWWSLTPLAREKGELLPAELALQLREASFCLVRCACSFRPARDGKIEWARLSVTLEGEKSEIQPTAFDIYPREVYHEVDTDVKINIAPSLKFLEMELKAGEILTTVHFTKLEPIIVGTGVQESNPCWDFEKYANHHVCGIKFLYMIVKRPLTVPSVQIGLDVVARVRTKNGLLPAKIEGLRNQLVQTICT